MPMTATFLGHAGFLFSDGSSTIAVDPYLTGNPLATHKPADIRCGYIALTHGHADHFGDTIAIARANNATVIGAFEVVEYLGQQGISRVEPLNPGGRLTTDFGWVAMTQAIHSSSYQGRYMGPACGLVVHIGGVTVYHCGDTDLFGDMRLIGEIFRPDIACIPIGDRFTMGPDLATRAAEWIRPKVAIPIHFNTWPPIQQDASAFRPQGVEVKLLKPGESWPYGS